MGGEEENNVLPASRSLQICTHQTFLEPMIIYQETLHSHKSSSHFEPNFLADISRGRLRHITFSMGE